jgi:hypothetical protein
MELLTFTFALFVIVIIIAVIRFLTGAPRRNGWIEKSGIFTGYPDYVARRELSKMQNELDDLKRELEEMKK